MTDETTRDIIARLRAQEEELTALRRIVAPRRAARRATATRPARGTRRIAALALALLVALVPLSVLAVNPFTDLNPGSVHNDNIDAIYNAGVTTGCVPNAEYCPNATVTREEMASFLARLGGLGNNKPTANAARLAITNPVAGGTTYAANELARVTRNSESSAAVTDVSVLGSTAATPFPAATATLEAPRPGFILVNADVIFRFTACPGCTMIAQINNEAVVSVTTADGNFAPISLTWVLTVDEPGPVNITLLLRIARPGQVPPGVPSGTYSNPHITAIFVPFGPDGGPVEAD